MAETSTIFGFMKYVSATDILSDFKKTVDSHFVNSLKEPISWNFQNIGSFFKTIEQYHYMSRIKTTTSIAQNLP